jgi:hypothetical protein
MFDEKELSNVGESDEANFFIWDFPIEEVFNKSTISGK